MSDENVISHSAMIVPSGPEAKNEVFKEDNDRPEPGQFEPNEEYQERLNAWKKTQKEQ